MKRKKLIILILVVVIGFIYSEKLQVTPMEEFNISAGFGFDIKKELGSNVEYNAPFNIYQFNKQQGESSNITGELQSLAETSRNINGKAKSLGETRQERQLTSDKPLLVGVQRIIVIGKESAAYGVLNLINIFFANAQINDRSMVVVCKGKSEDLLTHKVEGYTTSSDYIEGIIKHAVNYNFFSKEYTLLNIYTTLDSEGRNLILPYIEVKRKEIALTGTAVFKGDKMVYVLPMEESKIMNILRERAGKGILSLQESSSEYINYDTKVKRKVKCNKKDGKYEFNIDLNFQGDIIENTLYKDMNKQKEKEFEEVLSKKIEKMCNDFLFKMKSVYKIDCLELGQYGAGKYGRETGVDWNKEVSNADIKVKVTVKIDKIGIGQR